jgi:uncharacterized protein (TIGR03546 family)
MLKGIINFFMALNGNIKKEQLAAGFSWGLLLALLPAPGFFWVLLFVVSFFFRHNHAAKIFVMAIVKLIMAAVLPRIDELGWMILHIPRLQPLFTTLYNMPFVPFTQFNNTLVAGGLAAGIVLWLPFYILLCILIPVYRKTLAPLIRNSRLVKAVAKLPLVVAIHKIAGTASDIKSSLV